MTKTKEKKPKTGGRKKGTPNKTTKALKEAVMGAFEQAGGEKYLTKIAEDDPKTFCSLLGRILPTEMKGELDLKTHMVIIKDMAGGKFADD